ncbi:response regulator transcription factor [Ligilactobacillus aviarius]|uniref:DNA-binding response regulator n=1 Tax=Ligilactobacillus aviarius TaxID=1606 RepID=A0A510WUV5_9LACO|nr:response regulator transcription factor [Ligilactobacillus aviarius]KRM39069.1 response regulator protein GraR [Ligilactobacillus aviarius subsp. aviarius DSM 20655]GEK41805.1 DNA-binding response regulator [Ligilactobacillus aviarius]
MTKIFVIEDDKAITGEIIQTLNKWNYNAKTVSDWQNIQTEVSKFQPDLITMDISLPTFDGFYWIEQIRQITNAPIIFLTAQSINNDGVRALAAGANDFIEKPFAMDYLIAKIQLLLKENPASSTSITVDDFQLNSLTNTVKHKDTSIRLTPTEAIILKILFRSPHEVVSKKKFIKFLWENDQFINENILEVNISRLRQKLSQLDDRKHIMTIRGKGYQWIN